MTTSATGLTAARMLEIEAASVVEGQVIGDDLILKTHGGDLINAGNVRGPAGADTFSSVDFSFVVASTTWVCNHNLGFAQVDVTTFDSSGEEIFGDVSYVNANTVEITWYYPTSGTATIQR